MNQDLTYYCDDARHLICVPYSKSNLHRMAAELGIKKTWYHAGRWPHYDVPKKRVVEIKAKCKVVTARELLAIIRHQVEIHGHLTEIPTPTRLAILKRRK